MVPTWHDQLPRGIDDPGAPRDLQVDSDLFDVPEKDYLSYNETSYLDPLSFSQILYCCLLPIGRKEA